MYSTCLYCHGRLGQNDVVESFPVGRRLAFDAVRGRLWVICRHCDNWNLSPLEQRWEAVEECERAYRATHIRVSTDNIGLAQPHWGFELVRIGAALRPEIAAWRYGTKLLTRHTTIAGYAKNLGVNQRTVMKLRTVPRRFDVLARVPLGNTRATVRYAHLPDAELAASQH